jgi:predicted nucleic acid-binding protein
MSVIVVDASIGLKWFVPEIHSVEARRWRSASHDLHVPASFFEIEIANVLWKIVRRGDIEVADADAILSQIPALPLNRHAESPLLTSTLDLAVETQRTVYDRLYLALAIQLGGRMVTADRRLFNSLSSTPWASSICWVEDLP